MSLAQASTIPSIQGVFGGYPKLMTALEDAKFRSVIPIMLLPREALREFDGIGPHAANQITAALGEHGFTHHTVFERLVQYIEKQFGCIEDTPIAALHVKTVSDEKGTRQMYAPVRLLHHLEAYEPHMVVRDLSGMRVEAIHTMLSQHVEHGPVVERIIEDVREINKRLAWWDHTLCIVGETRRQKLRAVNE